MKRIFGVLLIMFGSFSASGGIPISPLGYPLKCSDGKQVVLRIGGPSATLEFPNGNKQIPAKLKTIYSKQHGQFVSRYDNWREEFYFVMSETGFEGSPIHCSVSLEYPTGRLSIANIWGQEIFSTKVSCEFEY